MNRNRRFENKLTISFSSIVICCSLLSSKNLSFYVSKVVTIMRSHVDQSQNRRIIQLLLIPFLNLTLKHQRSLLFHCAMGSHTRQTNVENHKTRFFNLFAESVHRKFYTSGILMSQSSSGPGRAGENNNKAKITWK